MADQLLVVQLLYALGAVVAAGTCGLLYRYRTRTGALALLAMMGGMAVWSGALFAFTTTDSPTVASLSLRFVFVGVAAVSITKLLFVLEYTGREHLLRPRILVPLAVPPVALVVLAFTNPSGLFFTTLTADPGGDLAIAFEFGPATLGHLVYAYALNVAVTVLIVGFLYRSRSVYRGQSLALLGGSLAPWIANAVYAFDVVTFDITPLGGVVAGILFTVAITRYRLLDLMPIARDRVLETITDGVLVVDREGRLVDVNLAGQRLLAAAGVETDDLVGRRLRQLLAETPLGERYPELTATDTETTIQFSIGERHVTVTATPIADGRDRHVGWLLLTHDVTDRKRREQRLEAQNERLERFASLVSHDLRNPLNVANGYLDLAREAGAGADTDTGASGTATGTADVNEQYLDEIADSHDRMETIIDDVLALAREGQAVTDPEPVALADLAADAWDGVETGSASLSVETDATVLADPNRLRRALENLYRNAIEHGTDDAGGTDLAVRVGSIDDIGGADGSGSGFYVADDGIGIPACRRDQALEDGYTTGESGTGLGLSIVESIATAHGWTVRVEESTTGGTRISITGVDTDAAVTGEQSVPADDSTATSPLSESS